MMPIRDKNIITNIVEAIIIGAMLCVIIVGASFFTIAISGGKINCDKCNCNSDSLEIVIKEQQKIIDKYSGYENWYREVHGIDTTKMVKFREKK